VLKHIANNVIRIGSAVFAAVILACLFIVEMLMCILASDASDTEILNANLHQGYLMYVYDQC